MASVLNFSSRKVCTVQDPTHLIAATNASYMNPSLQTIAIEVKGAASPAIQIEGCMDDYNEETRKNLDDADCTWFPLAIINSADYSVADKIASNGIYYVSIAGTKRFRFNIADISAISAATISIQKME